jgi:hypothetical protein
VQGAEQAERHLVVRAEHRADVVAARDPASGLVAAARRPVTGQVLRRPQTSRVHRSLPAGQPGACFGPRLRSREVQDVGVAELDQVPRREVRAGRLVHADRPAGLRLVALDDDHRCAQILLGAGDVQRLVGRRDQDDRLDAVVAQVVDGVGQLLAGEALQVGRADEVAGLAAGRLDAPVDGARSPESALRPDHADGRGASGDQRPGRAVGPVAQLADGLQHPLAGLRAQVGLPVDHPRDGLVRHAGQSGDVGHHRRPVGRGARGGLGHRCRRVAKRWMTTKTRSSPPMTIRVHQELRVPSKEMKVWIVPSTRTPSSEPTT